MISNRFPYLCRRKIISAIKAITSHTISTCFHTFRTSVAGIPLPEKFTFPFYYDPHPLALLAAQELQQHLEQQTDWVHPFGQDGKPQEDAVGKMFGVLVVQNEGGILGYLAAFSGKMADSNHLPGFVPPLFDTLAEGGFFLEGVAILNTINARVKELETSPTLLDSKTELTRVQEQGATKTGNFRAEMKAAKKARKIKRETARQECSSEEFLVLEEQLRQESIRQNYYFKDLVKYWRAEEERAQAHYQQCIAELNALKEERKQRSNALQQRLFEQYQFLNKAGEVRNLIDIFAATPLLQPPAGAGECAAPKLFQYAFSNSLHPIALAEFWWGQSPRSAVRKHGNFYPACRGKCEPILGHMLAGIKMDENPVLNHGNPIADISLVYEDEHLLIINKPTEFLSVPGRYVHDSVQARMKEKYPEATGPLVAHRLDMSTSGLMVIGKTLEVYKFLQRHFMKRTVEKRYVALLDGIIPEDTGFIDLPLRQDFNDRPRQMVCFEHGKPARTRWEVIERKNGKTRIHFYPVTGRTHQLRVHAAHHLGLNAPIIGDDLYGIKADRLHLHAAYISFKHPVSKEMVDFFSEANF